MSERKLCQRQVSFIDPVTKRVSKTVFFCGADLGHVGPCLISLNREIANDTFNEEEA